MAKRETASDKRTLVPIYLKKSEREEIRIAAEKDRRSVSDFVGTTVLRHIRGEAQNKAA